MSLSVENKSLPPIANILSIKTQTFDDFSFREPVVRIKLIFSPHLTHLFYHNKIFVTINTNKRPTLFGHCVYWEMYVIGMNSNHVHSKQKRIWENVSRRETSNIQLIKKRFTPLYQKHLILYNNNTLNKSAYIMKVLKF
jgi:hypothetical protein